MDSLAERYYSISPYAYCANNPVKYIDPDGTKIVVGSQLGRILAFIGFNNFESKVQMQIEDLRNMDIDLKTSIDYLQSSEKNVYIHEIPLLRTNRGNYTKPESDNLNIEQGSSIGYSPDNYTTNQNNKRPPIVGLMHELGHAENYMRGNAVEYNATNARNGISPDVENGNQDELNSIQKENIVRQKLNIEERLYEYYKNN